MDGVQALIFRYVLASSHFLGHFGDNIRERPCTTFFRTVSTGSTLMLVPERIQWME